MKIAVVKLGARVSFNSKDSSGGNGEARSIIKMLASDSRNDVVVYTKVLSKDCESPYSNVNIYDIETHHTSCNSQNYDALVVINGNVNFFGGAEDVPQILNYWMINNIKCPVFYVHCDPALSLRQLWPAIEPKVWASNWDKKDIEIIRNDIICIHQPYNVEWLENEYSKKGRVPIAKFVHYPLEKFPLLEETLPPNPTPMYDLMYGGTMRGGKREANLIKYYFGWNHDFFKVLLFGKIDIKKFKKLKKLGMEDESSWPEFGKPVKYADMIPTMNNSLAHIVIGDDAYSKCEMINQRTYEAIAAGNIVFIDSAMDPSKRVYGSCKDASDLLYVSSREDVESRLSLIKEQIANDPLFVVERLIKLQNNAINFNAAKYCSQFTDLIAGEIQHESTTS